MHSYVVTVILNHTAMSVLDLSPCIALHTLTIIFNFAIERDLEDDVFALDRHAQIFTTCGLSRSNNPALRHVELRIQGTDSAYVDVWEEKEVVEVLAENALDLTLVHFMERMDIDKIHIDCQLWESDQEKEKADFICGVFPNVARAGRFVLTKSRP